MAILTLSVLAAALMLCAASLFTVNHTVDEALRLRGQALVAFDQGRSDAARDGMQALAGFWERRNGVMEMLASHDDLHSVEAAIADARICLECEDRDDFLRAMSTVDSGLRHLRDEEAVRWTNLY